MNIKRLNYILAWLIFFMASFFALGGFNAEAPAAPSINAVAATSTQTFYVTKINDLRAQRGLPPVRLLIELNQSASTKATHMATNHYWSHDLPTGVSFSDFIFAKVPNAQLVGENLARCYPTDDKAFNALVASPTHYEIMVGKFDYVGIGQAFDPTINCTITAMHFARL